MTDLINLMNPCSMFWQIQSALECFLIPQRHVVSVFFILMFYLETVFLFLEEKYTVLRRTLKAMCLIY